MKKSFVFFLAIVLLLICTACSKKAPAHEVILETDSSEQLDLEELKNKESILELEVIPEELIPSVILSPNALLNLFGRDGKMHGMKTLSRGNIFEILPGSEMELNEEKYFHAVYDYVDFWIFADYVAPESVPAIAIEEINCESGKIKFGQIVAQSISDKNLVYYFDNSQKKVCRCYTDSEKISTYADDVQMAAIVEKLRVTTRATPRNELFLKAEKLNPSPAMKKVLDGEKTEKLSYDYQEVLKAMPGARYIVNMDELNTVDQSKDPFKN